VRLGQAVLAGGAPGLHLYAFNQHDTVLSVLEGCGALPAPIAMP
jgi:methylenetetrahydrofolate reductase (NADPH)